MATSKGTSIMKLRSFVLPLLLMTIATYAACQNGPTPATITVTFTQATTTGTSGPVVANCVYSGTASGAYTFPGKCSSVPVTSFLINSGLTRGTKYFIAVTAQYTSSGGTAESAYSAEVTATPPQINAPTGLATGLLTQLFFPPSLTHPQPITTASADGSLKAVAK